jgi:DNA-binding response OmpR family regulator
MSNIEINKPNGIKEDKDSAVEGHKKFRVLCVDDEPDNLFILTRYLTKAGYDVEAVENGEDALDRIFSLDKPRIDVVLLDRMMPGIDGMDVLQKIKANPSTCDIPVILQTGVMGEDEAVKGINMGAFYYLCKPYDGETAVAITNSALKDAKLKKNLAHKVDATGRVVNITKQAFFEYRTLDEAMNLAYFLTNSLNNEMRDNCFTALSALLTNAVEHGNLGLGYDGKAEALYNNRYEQEIQERLNNPDKRMLKVAVTMVSDNDKSVMTIKDCGEGFDFNKYLDFDPIILKSPNGRGIAMANLLCNGCIEYVGNGNLVRFTITREEDEENPTQENQD